MPNNLEITYRRVTAAQAALGMPLVLEVFYPALEIPPGAMDEQMRETALIERSDLEDRFVRFLEGKREELRDAILKAQSKPTCEHQHSKVGAVLESGHTKLEGGPLKANVDIGLCPECHCAEEVGPENEAALIAAVRPLLEELFGNIFSGEEMT